MDWFLQHWQSIAVALIVAATVLVFARRLLRSRKSASCGQGHCNCAARTVNRSGNP